MILFASIEVGYGMLLPMQLKDQTHAVTLARRLGDTAHVSGLAIRLARLSEAGSTCPNGS
jgi:hypothetical protein